MNLLAIATTKFADCLWPPAERNSYARAQFNEKILLTLLNGCIHLPAKPLNLLLAGGGVYYGYLLVTGMRDFATEISLAMLELGGVMTHLFLKILDLQKQAALREINARPLWSVKVSKQSRSKLYF